MAVKRELKRQVKTLKEYSDFIDSLINDGCYVDNTDLYQLIKIQLKLLDEIIQRKMLLDELKKPPKSEGIT